MLEQIRETVRHVMWWLRREPVVDDEAFMHDAMVQHWRNVWAEAICNHNRDEDGYCANCHTSK